MKALPPRLPKRISNPLSHTSEIFFDFAFLGAWYGVTLVLFSRSEEISPAWQTQGRVLILITILLSGIAPFRERKSGIIGILAVKAVLAFLLSYPLGANLYLRMLFQMPVLLEAILYLPGPWGSLLAWVGLALSLIMPRSVSAWGKVLSAVPPWETAFIFLFQGLILLFLTRYRRQKKLLLREKKQTEMLNRALQKVIDTNMGYQNYASSIQKKTLEEERKRVSRELHDIIGYTLTNQLMIVQAARSFKQENRSKLNTLLEKAEMTLRESLEEARRSLRQLRTEPVPGSQGLRLFIKLAKNFQEITGIKVDLELTTLSEGIPPRKEKALYRMIQEGMTNALRHGRADTIRIILSEDAGGYECVIRDNGRGAAEVEKGIGLRGMDERVGLLGGSLNALSTKDGFTLRCRLPKGDHGDSIDDR